MIVKNGKGYARRELLCLRGEIKRPQRTVVPWSQGTATKRLYGGRCRAKVCVATGMEEEAGLMGR